MASTNRSCNVASSTSFDKLTRCGIGVGGEGVLPRGVAASEGGLERSPDLYAGVGLSFLASRSFGACESVSGMATGGGSRSTRDAISDSQAPGI